ncbi:MAG: hypothetical protein WCG25_03320 [bacterium]
MKIIIQEIIFVNVCLNANHTQIEIPHIIRPTFIPTILKLMKKENIANA